MNKLPIQAVKGTRDFYPEEMAFRSWLYDKIKQVSNKFGYQEFDGPYIEYLDLYADKTSEEILKEQAFSLQDRDGKDILLRPEITPTFARMVAEKGRQLLQPIRWFSFGRAYRYEQPQKGRTREFFQWEINVLGPETPEADAEILAIATEYFKALGLTADQVVIRVNDRSYFEQILDQNSISRDKFIPLLRIIDRKEKISQEQFDNLLTEAGLNQNQVDALNSYFNSKDYSKSEWLSKLFTSLKSYEGVLNYIEYDPIIARGFDYYTRTVFEAWDKTGNLKRALFGGGRFDNLTESLGGERIPGVGMAPGDVPIQVLLEALGKIPDIKPKTATVLVTVFNEELASKSTQISALLRSNNIDTEGWVEPGTKLDKQLRYANQRGIPYVVIIGPEEASQNLIILKDFNNQTQEKISAEELISKLS